MKEEFDNGHGGKLRRVVVKIGTSTLVDEKKRLKIGFLYEVARQVDELRKHDIDTLIVTSGAIGIGVRRLRLKKKPDDVPTLQACAAIGQVELASRYDEAFYHYGIQMAQVLLTRYETGVRESYLHARDTLEKLLELHIVPLINENDTVAVDEILFGDNDTLATVVATMINADLVILLTDIDGLYTADPRKSEDAELLEKVGDLTEDLYNAAGGSGSTLGSGGMITKVKAARVLMSAGIPMVICQGSRPNVILDVARGENIGTLFDSNGGKHHTNAKKLWIALGRRPEGDVLIDDGAVKAIREKGSSLLPVGVKSISGEFEAGDPVNIMTVDGKLVGRGIVRMGHEDLDSVKGMKSSEIKEDEKLSHLGNRVVVHRNEMVIF
ncbi:MAG: glutamate 5-kinase [Coriobacteriales bacterium]|jgi:glutamate 5-kinase